jgi:Raf kinase inhibitor-like YbhB/YbcL family protein
MRNRLLKAAAGTAAVWLYALAADAQNVGPAAQGGPPVLAKELARARVGGRISVTSTAFSSGNVLGDKYTQNGANMSPPLAWTRGPTGTQSYVILAEDSGVNRSEPIVHWVVYNIPSTVRTLREDMPEGTTLPNGALQGKNVSGQSGYLGPKPPAGQTHPYHFQVFALNTRLNIDPANADRAAVIEAMKGKVLALGDIVANYTGN